MSWKTLKAQVESLSSDDLATFGTWLDGYIAAHRVATAKAPGPSRDAARFHTQEARQQRRFEHVANLDVAADIEELGGARFRYSMTIKSGGEGKTACVIMTNPATADAVSADSSIKKLETLVFQRNVPEFQGVRTLIVVNLFARMQTELVEGREEDIGPRNDLAVEQAIRAAQIVVLAWDKKASHERQRRIFDFLRQMPGKEVFKARKHPSRMNYADFMDPFDVSSVTR